MSIASPKISSEEYGLIAVGISAALVLVVLTIWRVFL